MPCLKVATIQGVFAKAKTVHVENASLFEEDSTLKAAQQKPLDPLDPLDLKTVAKPAAAAGDCSGEGGFGAPPPHGAEDRSVPLRRLRGRVLLSASRTRRRWMIPRWQSPGTQKTCLSRDEESEDHRGGGELLRQPVQQGRSPDRELPRADLRHCQTGLLHALQQVQAGLAAALKTLTIGNDCFPTANLVVKSAAELESIRLGRNVFSSFRTCKLANLPKLHRLDTDTGALQGSSSCGCKASLQRLPELEAMGEDAFTKTRVMVHRVGYFSQGSSSGEPSRRGNAPSSSFSSSSASAPWQRRQCTLPSS